MARSTDKPHIHLVKGLLGLPFWVCRMPGKIDGAGRDPQSAYRDWRLQNFSQWGLQRKIDLGRYAGTYGGYLPDQAMAAHATWWMLAWAAWESCKRFIVGGLVAAAILWLLWG